MSRLNNFIFKYLCENRSGRWHCLGGRSYGTLRIRSQKLYRSDFTLIYNNLVISSAFINTVFGKAGRIIKQYKNSFIIFAGTGFLESGGREIAVAPIS